MTAEVIVTIVSILCITFMVVNLAYHVGWMRGYRKHKTSICKRFHRDL